MLSKHALRLAGLLSCAGVIFAGGQGPGPHQNGPGQGQNPGQGPASQPGQPAANSGQSGIIAIHDMTGTLADIVGGFAIGHPYFEFIAGGTTYNIKAAPYKFLVNLKIPDLVGKQVRMIFAECRQGSFLALQIHYETNMYVLRDESGTPAWRKWPAEQDPASGPSLIHLNSIDAVTAVVRNIGISAISNTVRVQVRLRDQRMVWVTLGPDSLLLDQGFELQVGDRITMMFALQASNEECVALQLENHENGLMARIRDQEGHHYRLRYE